eukprot:COSAG02_NODE_768_length_17375_cov_52.865015_7_plen_140_part_00
MFLRELYKNPCYTVPYFLLVYRTVRIAHVWGCRLFTVFLSARNLSLNFFGTDCAQVFNFPSCPNVRNTHGSVGSTSLVLIEERERERERAAEASTVFLSNEVIIHGNSHTERRMEISGANGSAWAAEGDGAAVAPAVTV